MKHPLTLLSESGFWKTSSYATETFVEPPATPEQIAVIEAELGYKLPASYIALMAGQNGGMVVNGCFPTREAASWTEDYVAIDAFAGIGHNKCGSLCSDTGSTFLVIDCGYPPIGIYFGHCPSGGHDMIALDYRTCGPLGEPQVVHVDQGDDYRITFLAKDFETFVLGLRPDSDYAPDPEIEKQAALAHVRQAPLSRALTKLCHSYQGALEMETVLRKLSEAIVDEKGYFALHADERSHLMYDLQFLLHTAQYPVRSLADYLEYAYPQLIAMPSGDNVFSTGGWAPDFLNDWWTERVQQQQLQPNDGVWRFTPDYQTQLRLQLTAFS